MVTKREQDTIETARTGAAMTSRIEAVMLHDATVRDLRVHDGGKLTLSFEGVTAYRRITSDLYDTWIHRAILRVTGVTALLIQGPGWTKDDDDYVLTDTVVNSLGQKIHWIDVRATGVRRIELLIFSGARIEIECAMADLKLSRGRELDGQWEGPLFQTPKA